MRRSILTPSLTSTEQAELLFGGDALPFEIRLLRYVNDFELSALSLEFENSLLIMFLSFNFKLACNSNSVISISVSNSSF